MRLKDFDFVVSEAKLYYVVLYYSDEIIDITDDLQKAFQIAMKNDNAVVTDEKDNILYYCNLDMPF